MFCFGQMIITTTLLLQEDRGTIKIFVPPTSLNYHLAWTVIIDFFSFVLLEADGPYNSITSTTQAYVNFYVSSTCIATRYLLNFFANSECLANSM